MPSSTIQLSRSINLAQQFVRNAPLSFVTGNNDPAFSNADWVRQFLLGPPFAWRWNRATVDITCIVGVSDYLTAITDFGWIEKAIIIDPENGNQSFELEVEMNLSEETVPNQPSQVSPQFDDGEGNITFRVSPAPISPYVLRLTYQKAAGVFSLATQTWSPIPDYLSYLYNQGFLAKNLEYINDQRYVTAMQLFLQQAVSANNGLTETQMNIFLTERMNSQRQQQDVSQGKR